MAATFPIYLEVGKKKVFASALNWPGWTRSGKTEDDALDTLFAYGSRYATVVTRLGYVPPKSTSAFTIDERVKGDAGTDFGVPGIPVSKDGRPIKADELVRLLLARVRGRLLAARARLQDGHERLAQLAGVTAFVLPAECAEIRAVGSVDVLHHRSDRAAPTARASP